MNKSKSLALLCLGGLFATSLGAGVLPGGGGNMVTLGHWAPASEAGWDENPCVAGLGSIKVTADGTLKVSFITLGLQPCTTYRVFISGGDLEVEFGGQSGGIVYNTMWLGLGAYYAETLTGPMTLTGNETVTLWIDDNGDNVRDAEEERAIGFR
jgi:hypothetical protein